MYELTRERTALIVIDMQNGFIDPGGSMARRGFDVTLLAGTIEPCRRLIDIARGSGVPVIYTRQTYRPDYRDAGLRVRSFSPRSLTERAFANGTWDAEILPELKPAASDFIIDKTRASPFIGTGIDMLLRSMEVDGVAICGVTTNVCVESTARDASQYDYRTFVVGDACAEMDPARHQHALQTLAYIFARVVTVDEVEAAWTCEPHQGGNRGLSQ